MPNNNRQEVHVFDIVRHPGNNMLLPQGVPLEAIIASLQRKLQEEETYTTMSAVINASPFDGAYALLKAMERLYGFTVQSRTQQRQVVVDALGNTVPVPWGRFEAPSMEDGIIYTDEDEQDGRFVFEIKAQIKGKYRDSFNDLVKLTKKIVAEESIYRGKAIEVTMTDDDGDPLSMPTMNFMNTAKAIRPIFSERIERLLDTYVFSYIQSAARVKQEVGSLKRGVLLAGPYGTGKTLTAGYIARLAEENGFTFFYAKKPSDIPAVIRLAWLYEDAIVFAEDVESVAGGEERTDEVNELLDSLDGVEAKKHNVICVFTTNHIDKLNSAMRRKGRIDMAVIIDEPDTDAVKRLIEFYSGNQLGVDDISGIATRIATEKMIPAMVQELVNRARLAAMLGSSTNSYTISAASLNLAADSLIDEQNVFGAPKTEQDLVEKFGIALGAGIGNPIGQVLSRLPVYNNNGHEAVAVS